MRLENLEGLVQDIITIIQLAMDALLVPLGGVAETIASIMPSKYVTDALTTLFLRGASLATLSIWIDLALVITGGIVVVIAGILIFERWGRGK